MLHVTGEIQKAASIGLCLQIMVNNKNLVNNLPVLEFLRIRSFWGKIILQAAKMLNMFGRISDQWHKTSL